MLAHRVFASIQRILPGSFSRRLRAAGTAFLTPIYFAHDTGHFRSSLRSKAVDRTGLPIPWYTYPAIQILKTKSFTNRRILEFGAGQSTIWWARQAESVVSFEGDAGWYAYIRPSLPPNASVYLVDDPLSNFEELVPAGSQFDVIIVDGLDRLIAAQKSVKLLAKDGLLILDNSEGFWGTPGTYPILDLLRTAGFARVDLYGFSPGNLLQHCTSFFYKGHCFLFEAEDYPVSLGTNERYKRTL